MWTRSLLKNNAKQALKGRYWRCFLVCFVLAILGVGSFSSRTIDRNSGVDIDSNDVAQFEDSALSDSTIIIMIIIVVLLILLFCLAYFAFVIGPLTVGRNRYFMENRQGLTPYSTVTSVFHKPYMNVVKVQLLVGLKVGLGCLVIVPGIYWAFCYRQVPYLLAENPYLTAKRAMELSRQMMDGEKWKSFVLDLSFIGWRILGILCFVVGLLFLEPYVQATNAELYAALRSKAFAQGLSTSEELAGFVRHENPENKN